MHEHRETGINGKSMLISGGALGGYPKYLPTAAADYIIIVPSAEKFNDTIERRQYISITYADNKGNRGTTKKGCWER